MNKQFEPKIVSVSYNQCRRFFAQSSRQRCQKQVQYQHSAVHLIRLNQEKKIREIIQHFFNSMYIVLMFFLSVSTLVELYFRSNFFTGRQPS